MTIIANALKYVTSIVVWEQQTYSHINHQSDFSDISTLNMEIKIVLYVIAVLLVQASAEGNHYLYVVLYGR